MINYRRGVIGVLVLLLVVLVIGVGTTWFVMRQPISSNTIPTPAISNEATAGWKSYSSSILGLSFKYPPEWGEVAEIEQENCGWYSEDCATPPRYYDRIGFSNNHDLWITTGNAFTFPSVDVHCDSPGQITGNGGVTGWRVCKTASVNGQDVAHSFVISMYPEGDGQVYLSQGAGIPINLGKYQTLTIVENYLKSDNELNLSTPTSFGPNVPVVQKELLDISHDQTSGRLKGEIDLFSGFISTFKINKTISAVTNWSTRIEKTIDERGLLPDSQIYATATLKYPQFIHADQYAGLSALNTSVVKLLRSEISSFYNRLPGELSGYPIDNTVPPSLESVYSVYEAKKAEIVGVKLMVSENGRHLAHPAEILETTLNYKIGSSTPLSLNSLFLANSRYLEKIAAQADVALAKAGLMAHSTGSAATAENYQQFSLTDEGLVIHFKVYQVGSRPNGAPKIMIPYQLLTEVINPAGPLATYLTSMPTGDAVIKPYVITNN